MPRRRAASIMFVPFGTATSLPSMLTVIRSIVAGGVIVRGWGCAVSGGASDELGGRVGPRPALLLGVGLELVAELADEALRRPCACLAERADRPARDLVGYALQERAVLRTRIAVHHARRDPLHPERALPAGRALAAALVGVGLELVAELADEALRRPCACLAERADRPARDLVGYALQERAVLRTRIAVHR